MLHEDSFEYSSEDEEDVVEHCPYSREPLPAFTREMTEAAQEFRDWLLLVSDRANDWLQTLDTTVPDDLEDDCDAADVISCPDLVRVIGDRDDRGQLHGEVEQFYVSGDYWWGHYDHGLRQGEASVVLANGDHYLGQYDSGALCGVVEEEREGGLVWRQCVYTRGVRHGQFREFSGRERRLSTWGHYSHGVRAGPCWTVTK